MAINIKFDLAGNPEPPTIVLAKRNGNKLGQLDAKEIELNDKFNDTSEISFILYKYVDGKLTNLWDEVVDFKLIHCKEWDMWFEITVELDEETETIKTVFCTQLGQAELSQIMLYDIHINEEGDSNWNIKNKTYKNTILYNPDDPSASLLHRLLKDKAPHYSILHVDDTIKNIQRTFSFDGTSIYDAFMEIAEEIGCLFIFHSNSDKNGKIQRTISVYDLQQNCLNPDCRHRGEFTDICPKCGSKDIDCNDEIFKDTTIFVTNDELASGGIQLTTDTDSVKNCFKLEAGDDLMTATIRNCNPNGTDYIWYFSEDMKSDMSKELVAALKDYDDKYRYYYNKHEVEIDGDLLSSVVCLDCGYKGSFENECPKCKSNKIKIGYNLLVEKYADRYNANSVHCLGCGHKGNFENTCPECGSNNLLIGDKLEPIETSIIGYPALMNTYYDVIDLGLYLESGLMPSVDISDDLKAKDYAAMLTNETLSLVAIDVDKIDNASQSTVDSAVESMAKIIFKSPYKVEAEASSLDDKDDEKIWTGKIKITNYSDEDDTATTGDLTIKIVKDDEILARQRIDKAMSKLDAKDLNISGLIAEEIKLDEDGEHIINEDESCECSFCKELKNYALNPLQSFYDACEECLTILQDQGAGNKEANPDLYKNLYNLYRKKLQAIAKEIRIRENEVNSICGVWNETDENNKVLVTKGLQQYIEDCKNEIQNALNFQKYLENKNEDVNLWLEFCTYRREDKYSNDNYISDGLNNAELFKRATKFVEVAENEIFKSAELQHSISTSLNNLLTIPKFQPLVEYFSVGNWIRVRIDEKVYKLRLLEYSINFDSFDTISVEFSDVIKIKTGVTDIQEILSQASSMATSYSSVQRQASQGEESNTVINNWITNGLDATNTKIVGNAENQNQVFDKNGILCREYDPITDTYNNEQLKIINSTIAITDDNWDTTKTAIGKFFYIDPITKETRIAYGINAETVMGKLLIGEELKIYNEEGNLSFDNSGFVVKATTNSGDTNVVTINPNDKESLFHIMKNSEKIFYIDDDGNLVIKGKIGASNLFIDSEADTNLADVALSGSYEDLIDKPNLADVALSGSYIDLNNKPDFADIAFSGSYEDLNDKPNFINIKYPTLTDEQKAQMVSLIDEYFSVRRTLFYYSGAARRESYATPDVITNLGYSYETQLGCVYEFTSSDLDDKIFETDETKKGNPYYKYVLNCGLFCQMIWMGRPITDFITAADGSSLTGADENNLIYYVENNKNAEIHHALQARPQQINTSINSKFVINNIPWGYYFDFDLSQRAYGAKGNKGNYYDYNSYIRYNNKPINISIDSVNNNNYSSKKESNGKIKAYPTINQVLVNSQFILTINEDASVNANTYIQLGTISEYTPDNLTPVAVYNKDRAFMGHITKDGKIFVYCNEKLGTGTYYITINTSYIPTTQVSDTERIPLGFDGAANMAQELYLLGYEVPYSEIDIGDMVFFKASDISEDFRNETNDDDDDALMNRNFRNISHVGVVYDFNNGYPVIADCTNAYESPMVIWKTSMESTSTFARTKASYERNNVVMVARHPAAFGLGGNVPDKFTPYRGTELGN